MSRLLTLLLLYHFDYAVGQHLTFGSGIHRCIGSDLAHMELRIAAEVILEHLDDIQLAIPIDEIAYLPTLATQTIQSLPLQFSKRILKPAD